MPQETAVEKTEEENREILSQKARSRITQYFSNDQAESILNAMKVLSIGETELVSNLDNHPKWKELQWDNSNF
jgi:hypothetical protein